MNGAALRRLVLDAVSSQSTRAMYGKALDDFFTWWAGQGRPPFAHASVQAHRAWLEERGTRAGNWLTREQAQALMANLR
jgi:hypothetical protein